jgi:archaellum component FlaC
VRRKDKELEAEICRRQCEVDELMQRCTELENTLANSQGRAENLQKAVDLYLNSINVLEASEEKARIEVKQHWEICTKRAPKLFIFRSNSKK